MTTLAEASARHPELMQRALSSVSVDELKFIALWNVMWRGGLFIHVPTGVQAHVPVWVAHAASGDGLAVFPTTVVLMEQVVADAGRRVRIATWRGGAVQ